MSDSGTYRPVIVVFGVSGSGKTTVAKLLSEKLSVPYYDADDFHPQANIDKMSNGHALNDDDRRPWLQALSDRIGYWQYNGGAILACSALKEQYRELLAVQAKHIYWVLLWGTFELIRSRMEARKAHFMAPSLLQSQFDTLEVPDYGLTIDVGPDPETIVNTILTKLNTYE